MIVQRKELTDDELRHWYDWNARKRNEKGSITAQDLRLLEMQLSICEELFRRRSVPSERVPMYVWAAENKTSVALFSTEEGAQRYVSSFSASVGGGITISKLAVLETT